MRLEPYWMPPISGSIPEARFDAIGGCSWFRFEMSADEAWAGVFGNGEVFGGTRGLVYADDRTALVLARGKAYVVDAVRRELLYKAGDLWWRALSVPGRDFVVVADSSGLAVLGRQQQLWERADVALDGILLDSATASELHGKVWDHDGWWSFSLAFDGWKYERVALLSEKWDAFESPFA